MSSAPFCQHWYASKAALAGLLAYAQTFQFKESVGWGFWNCRGDAERISGRYYYPCMKRLELHERTASGVADASDQVRAIEYIDWDLNRETQNLRASGKRAGLRALLDKFARVPKVSYLTEKWELDLAALLDALPAALGRFDLLAGSLPQFIAGDGLRGGGRVIFLQVEKARELLDRHAGQWQGIELRGQWGGAKRVKISADGRLSFHDLKDPQSRRHESFREPAEALFMACHALHRSTSAQICRDRQEQLDRRQARRGFAVNAKPQLF